MAKLRIEEKNEEKAVEEVIGKINFYYFQLKTKVRPKKEEA